MINSPTSKVRIADLTNKLNAQLLFIVIAVVALREHDILKGKYVTEDCIVSEQ